MRRFFPLFLLIISFSGIIWAEKRNNDKESLRELVSKAKEGNARAMYELAKLHDIGYDSIPVDSVRSTALYLLSAQKGYAPARNFIGFRYYKGEILKQNTDSALYWINLAAEEGDITAAANLGYLLTQGEDIERDEEEALKWLKIATEGGVPQAQEEYVKLMIPKWETLSSDSVYQLGLKYYLGSAPIAGAALLEIASTHDLAKADALLGDAYSKGRGVDYNHSKSISHFFKAAKEGDPSAQFIIAELLEVFPDVLNEIENNDLLNRERDNTDPIYWYSKAAEQGVKDSETAYLKLYSIP